MGFFKDLEDMIKSEDVKKIIGKVESSVKQGYNVAKDYVTALKDELYVDGKFDKDKAVSKVKTAGKNAKELIEVMGKKAYDAINDAITEGNENSPDLEIPSDDELNNKYKDIGTKYHHGRGQLFRKHYEECLKFYDKMSNNLQYATEKTAANALLQDIKHSASKDVNDLITFYDTTTSESRKLDPLFAEKKKVIDRYILNK